MHFNTNDLEIPEELKLASGTHTDNKKVWERAFVPETANDFTDASISIYQLTDNEGNIWGGKTSLLWPAVE